MHSQWVSHSRSVHLNSSEGFHCTHWISAGRVPILISMRNIPVFTDWAIRFALYWPRWLLTAYCPRAKRIPLGSRSGWRRWSYCACALRIFLFQTHYAPVEQCIVYTNRACWGGHMFCERVQCSCSCPPHFQRTSHGAWIMFKRHDF
jgi:hypothetical protein